MTLPDAPADEDPFTDDVGPTIEASDVMTALTFTTGDGHRLEVLSGAEDHATGRILFADGSEWSIIVQKMPPR